MRSLVEMLRERAAGNGDTLAYTFLADGEHPRDSVTYGALDRRARAIAATLVDAGVRPGDRAVLLYPPGLDFIAGFFGSLYAGVVAVPCYPPHASQLSRALPRLLAVIGDADASVVLCPAEIAALAPSIAHRAPSVGRLRWITTDAIDPAIGDAWRTPAVGPDSLAFLQYTSGSTALPRGVMVSHGNLLHNLACAAHVEENDATSRSVSWLPVIHDMGLIEGVLQPMYGGFPAYLMAPMAFLQRPLRWLRAISTYRATNSGGPNFAYDLCVRKITNAQRESLDLSTWRVAYNGAEPIRRDSLVAFHDTFRDRGFRWRAFYPVYGLAEATLVVSSGRQSYEAVSRVVDASALADGRVAAPTADGAPTTTLVASGPPAFDTDIVIVDADTGVRRADGEVGEIWVSSPSVAQGYWNRPDDTRATFHATLPGSERPYLRTGDLGAIVDGDLIVVGRIKDMLIVRGMKYAPQDLELTAEGQHPALRRGCVAAFAVAGDDGERIVLAAEIDPRRLGPPEHDRSSAPADASTTGHGTLDDIAARIQHAVFDEHGIQLHGVVLLRPGGIAMTTSGKIRRGATALAFLRGELDEVRRWTHTPAPAAASPPPREVVRA